MPPLDKRAELFSKEIDRYLLGSQNADAAIPPDDIPDLKVGLKLLEIDFKDQSRIQASLRRNIEIESRNKIPTSAERLIHHAASHNKTVTIKNWKYWSAILAVLTILFIWSWSATGAHGRAVIAPSLQVSPEIILTTAHSVSHGQIMIDPQAVPTPLAPPTASTVLSSNTPPYIQHTPLGTTYIAPADILP